MTEDATLWVLAKGANCVRVVSRAVPDVGVKFCLFWNDDTRATQMYRTSVELAAAVNRHGQILRCNAEATGMQRNARD